ncbi:MAG TPA: Fe-S-binding domain-containing protein, partial [Thermoanaerobaculia bacterium]|nr:Fe-S-binding domain-containing protein [Thermoanaerobaculia bacterium]
MDHILNIITYIPLAGALVILFFVNKNNTRAIRVMATATAVVDFIVSLYLWINFDPNKLWQFEFKVSWIPSLGVDYHFGV